MLTKEKFIEASSIKHNFKYDYSKIDFINSRVHVEIICPLHGSFNQPPYKHKGGQGCPICKKRLTKEEFIYRSKLIHGDNYIYDKVVYTTNRIPVLITCKLHGDFQQSPTSHMKGHGCKKCNMVGRYSINLFEVNPDLKYIEALLYVVKIANS